MNQGRPVRSRASSQDFLRGCVWRLETDRPHGHERWLCLHIIKHSYMADSVASVGKECAADHVYVNQWPGLKLSRRGEPACRGHGRSPRRRAARDSGEGELPCRPRSPRRKPGDTGCAGHPPIHANRGSPHSRQPQRFCSGLPGNRGLAHHRARSTALASAGRSGPADTHRDGLPCRGCRAATSTVRASAAGSCRPRRTPRGGTPA